MYLMLMPLKIVNLYIWRKKNIFTCYIHIWHIFIFNAQYFSEAFFLSLLNTLNSILVIVDQFIVVYIDID